MDNIGTVRHNGVLASKDTTTQLTMRHAAHVSQDHMRHP